MLQRLDARAPLPWPVLVLGLKGPIAARHDVARLLLRRRLAGDQLPPDAVAALADLRRGATAADDPYLTMTFELVRRGEAPDAPPVPLGAAIAALDAATMPADVWLDSWLSRLEEREYDAIRARFERFPRVNRSRDPVGARAPASIVADSDSVVRMVRPLTWRLTTDLGALTGCHPRANQILAVPVSYRPTGQVRDVLPPMGLGAEDCATAARLLAALDVVGGQEPLAPERTDLVMIGFRPEDVACSRVEATIPPAKEIVGPPSSVRAPRKRRDVAPVYPESMQKQRMQGMVIAQATIATNGCVADATVLQGPHTVLKAAALAAISQWRYEPSLLNGKPIPIIMTVTVNFALQ
jgi:TonB family protein